MRQSDMEEVDTTLLSDDVCIWDKKQASHKQVPLGSFFILLKWLSEQSKNVGVWWRHSNISAETTKYTHLNSHHLYFNRRICCRCNQSSFHAPSVTVLIFHWLYTCPFLIIICCKTFFSCLWLLTYFACFHQSGLPKQKCMTKGKNKSNWHVTNLPKNSGRRLFARVGVFVYETQLHWSLRYW